MIHASAEAVSDAVLPSSTALTRFSSVTHRVFIIVWQSAMSPAQKEAYEENKLKMRKAIADPALVDETEQVPTFVWDRMPLGCLV